MGDAGLKKNSNDLNVVFQTLEIEIQNDRQLKSSSLVHGLFHQSVNIGINPQNLAQGLLTKSFDICFAWDKNLAS